MTNSDAIKGVSSVAIANTITAKGVSWSKVASASNQVATAQLQQQVAMMMSPSTSGPKNSASFVSNNNSPSPSPSEIKNPGTSQICTLCKNVVTNNTNDEKRKMAIIACSHIFHNEVSTTIALLHKKKTQTLSYYTGTTIMQLILNNFLLISFAIFFSVSLSIANITISFLPSIPNKISVLIFGQKLILSVHYVINSYYVMKNFLHFSRRVYCSLKKIYM